MTHTRQSILADVNEHLAKHTAAIKALLHQRLAANTYALDERFADQTSSLGTRLIELHSAHNAEVEARLHVTTSTIKYVQGTRLADLSQTMSFLALKGNDEPSRIIDCTDSPTGTADQRQNASNYFTKATEAKLPHGHTGAASNPPIKL